MPEHNVQLSDQVVVLGTMHGKEQVIGPILTQELGVEVIVPIDFNTDQWGTFTPVYQGNGSMGRSTNYCTGQSKTSHGNFTPIGGCCQ